MSSSQSQPLDAEKEPLSADAEPSGAFTPGPWMAAAGPSSIVGWPVVAQRGQSICNLSWLGKKPGDVTDERFAEYRREVEANGWLIAAAPDLFAALSAITLATIVLEPSGQIVGPELDHFVRARAALNKAVGFSADGLTKALGASQ